MLKFASCIVLLAEYACGSHVCSYAYVREFRLNSRFRSVKLSTSCESWARLVDAVLLTLRVMQLGKNMFFIIFSKIQNTIVAHERPLSLWIFCIDNSLFNLFKALLKARSCRKYG